MKFIDNKLKYLFIPLISIAINTCKGDFEKYSFKDQQIQNDFNEMIDSKGFNKIDGKVYCDKGHTEDYTIKKNKEFTLLKVYVSGELKESFYDYNSNGLNELEKDSYKNCETMKSKKPLKLFSKEEQIKIIQKYTKAKKTIMSRENWKNY